MRTQGLSVSFDTTYEVCPNLSVHDYTRAESRACWFDEFENAVNRQECLKIIKKIQRGKPIFNSKQYCVRGLERMTPDAADRREFNKMNAYIAVLEEQNAQWHSGLNDPKRISRVYRDAAARRSQQEAGKMGQKDALVVQKLLSSKSGGASTTTSTSSTKTPRAKKSQKKTHKKKLPQIEGISRPLSSSK
jgi:hypothetical protein